MAKIQTPTRLIRVTQTYEEVLDAMNFQWMQLTEDGSFYGEVSNEFHKIETKITLNKNYIIEVQP